MQKHKLLQILCFLSLLTGCGKASFNLASETPTSPQPPVCGAVCITGHVWHHDNRLIDNMVNETGTTLLPDDINLYLINLGTGLIEQVTTNYSGGIILEKILEPWGMMVLQMGVSFPTPS